MKKLIYLAGLVLIIALSSCSECHPERESADGRHLEMAVLFHQQSAEYKALCYQAFNMAALALDMDLQNKDINKPRALVFDIDETVLDNSPYEAKCALEGISYPEQWKEWCELAKAKALPGAVEFINNAYNKGIAIFYISNRKAELFEVTKKNLLAEGLPLPADSFLLLRTDDLSKESRRLKVLETHHISLLFGDNMADFIQDYENKTTDERQLISDSIKKDLGMRYIVLPNTMYGDWEMALYDNNSKLDKEKKAEMRRNKLKDF